MSTQTQKDILAQQAPISCFFPARFRCCGQQLRGAGQMSEGVDVRDIANLAVVAGLLTNTLTDGSAVVGDMGLRANRALPAP